MNNRVSFSCILIALSIGVKCGAQINFGPFVSFEDLSNPSGIVSADFNGDGKIDVATANYGSNNVAILLGNGTGGFGIASYYPVSKWPLGLCKGDFNGDGKIDIATAGSGMNSVSVILGTGTGSFGPCVSFGVGTQPHSVTTADFNNDGIADLATSNWMSNNITVLFGTGSGSFGTGFNFSTSLYPNAIVSADFNGDGNKDIATANQSSNNLSIFLGNGAGGFSSYNRIGGAGATRSIASADFNNDGKIDLVTGNDTYNTMSVYLGTGTGTFGAHQNFITCSGAICVSPYDFNCDGKVDIAVSNRLSASVSVFKGDGAGNFVNSSCFPTTSDDRSVAVGDINGDNRPDLITANGVSNKICALLNLPILSLSPNVTICEGTSTALSAISSGIVSWSPSIGLSSTTGNLITASPSETTTYTATSSGCSAQSATVMVTVNPQPILLRNKMLPICEGQGVLLKVNSMSYCNFNWQSGTVVTLNATSSSMYVTPLTTTSYTVSATNSYGCTTTLTLTVVVKPKPIIDAGANIMFSGTTCGGTLPFSGQIGSSSNSTSYTYAWSPTTYLSSPASRVTGFTSLLDNTVVMNVQGAIPYTLTGTDPLTGCSSSDQVNLNVVGCKISHDPDAETLSKNLVDDSEGAFTIFPNPFKDEIKIKLRASKKIESAEIRDIFGRVQWKQNYNHDTQISEISINSSSFENGIYIVSIYTNEGVVLTQKLTKTIE
jgi:hypothetical protein